ncbi:GreA/GreB family elongation factor [Saccharothrix sp. MB29]|nr:GreA/GreB family elongation factor [Saccharothrix sp. MB29]
MSPDAHQRLRAELAGLLAAGAAPAHDGPARTRRGAVPRWRAGFREILELLNVAVVGQDPPDDGVAELGMVLTVRYDDTGDVETFLLGLRAVEHGDVEVYSPDSPLGAALTGARPGDQRTYRAPNGNSIRVTLLDAVPHGHHRSAGAS